MIGKVHGIDPGKDRKTLCGRELNSIDLLTKDESSLIDCPQCGDVVEGVPRTLITINTVQLLSKDMGHVQNN